MANVKDKVVQQGQAVVYTEANTNFGLMAAALKKDKSIEITIEQSFLSAYDMVNELRRLTKDKTAKSQPEIKPLLDPNKAITDIVKEGLYEKLKTYLDALTSADYEPPLPSDFVSPSKVTVRQFPNKIALDPRRTGRLIKLAPADALKSVETQKWINNNSVLYGFVMYADNGLYYMGVDAIKSSIAQASNKQEELVKIINKFAKSTVLLNQLSITAQQVLDSKLPPPPVAAAGQLPPSTDEFIDPLNGKTEKISSKIGTRMLNGAIQEHGGIDLGAQEGTPIYAMADGKIIGANHTGTGKHCNVGDMECGGGFGNYIRIRHLNGIDVYYAHMTDSIPTKGPSAGKDCRTPPDLKVGVTVKQGQLIGFVGNTGHSFGDHLHLEVEGIKGTKYAAYYSARFKDVNGTRRAPAKKPNIINPLFVLPKSIVAKAGSSIWADGATDNTPYYEV